MVETIQNWTSVQVAFGECAGDARTRRFDCDPTPGSCDTQIQYDATTGVRIDAGAPGGTEVTQVGTEINTVTGQSRSLGARCITPSQSVPTTTTGTENPEPVVITVTRREFDTLPVEPLTFTAGPEIGWIPVNMDVILYADSTEQTLTTTLLDTPVQVRAIPTQYTWTMGDGTTFTTTHPGRPYPNENITHQYTLQNWYDITLTTTFRGEYSVGGGPWTPIDGTIERTSPPQELYARSMRSVLVTEPTNQDPLTWQPPPREK